MIIMIIMIILVRPYQKIVVFLVTCPKKIGRVCVDFILCYPICLFMYKSNISYIDSVVLLSKTKSFL